MVTLYRDVPRLVKGLPSPLQFGRLDEFKVDMGMGEQKVEGWVEREVKGKGGVTGVMTVGPKLVQNVKCDMNYLGRPPTQVF